MRKLNKRGIVAIFLVTVFAVMSLTGCSGGAAEGFDQDNEIMVVTREEGSGTRDAFVELMGILEKGADGTKIDHTVKTADVTMKTGVMMTTVAGDTYSIGYISVGSLDDSIKAVKIDGVEPTAENIKSGAYILARPFNIATKADISETAQDFINFIMSAEGQEVVASGYIKMDENAAAFSGTNPTGKVVVAGSSSVTPIMEKLREAYLEINPNANVEVHQSDSSTGMNSAIEGTCDIGMASRDLKSEEAAVLKATSIAIDGISVIVNNENPLTNLTKDQIRGIYTGELLTWSEVK